MPATFHRLVRTGPGLLFAALVSACSVAAQATEITMYRDPNCGCCLAWADHAHDHFADLAGEENITVNTVDHPQMGALKAAHAVPADLAGCHTALVEGYVIEGHVPAREIEQLLRERPEGITGLAVPGMPLGSPGMEMGDHRQPYQVIAFGPDTRQVWAQYPGTDAATGG